ncbi:hypothetical protein, partial [Methylobacterium soli]|uniref:hypothetical protein n=1 Tax=Methylobacterium soli TaxID=553447 RepID=UPI001EE36EB1
REAARSATARPGRAPWAAGSSYVRLRAVPPRPANDNRSASAPKLWHWAVAIGTAPTIGLALALTILI